MTIEKEHADAWIRCIRDAGGSAGVSRQAVALAALNGLFDLHRIAALPWHSAPPEPTEGQVEAMAKAAFEIDWPKDDWSRFKPGDYVPERYRKIVRAALRAMPLHNHTESK